MFLEKKTQSGYFYQINTEKNNFQLFFNNKPIIDTNSENRARSHQIPYLFMNQGKFNLKPDAFEKIDGGYYFFPVKSGVLQIEIEYKGTVTVNRLLKVKLFEGIDSFLVKLVNVNFSQKFEPYTAGPSWMLMDWEEYKNNLIPLRLNHSGAVIYIYRSEELNLLEEKIQERVAPRYTRASDIVSSEGNDAFTDDPVFQARIYLRTLEWVKVKKLVFDLPMNKQKTEEIMAFLKTMLEKAATVPALQAQLKNIRSTLDYYSHLHYILGFDVQALEKYLDRCQLKNENITLFQEIIRAQKALHAKSDDPSVLTYLDMAHGSLNLLKKT